MQWILHHNKKKQTNDVPALWMPLKFIIMSGKSQSKVLYTVWFPFVQHSQNNKIVWGGEHSSG